nr:ABC transporter permease [Acidiphilium multivorum]
MSDADYEEALRAWNAPDLPEAASRGYWAAALARLTRNRTAIVATTVLAVVLLACLAAPLYAHFVAHTDPFKSNLGGTVTIAGKQVSVMQPASDGFGVTPIGPTWRWGPYMLGADGQGRNVAARLLYGGRVSLLVGAASTAICLLLASLLGVAAGFYGGMTDRVISVMLDILWAFPIYLLAISLSVILINAGFHLGPVIITSNDLIMPIGIIAIVYVPYVARPIRARVMMLRRSDFVAASISLGASDGRILRRDILPNVASTLIVFAPIMMALDIITEASLSFLGIGIQPPSASWGTIIRNGEQLLYTRPIVSLAPGLAIVMTVVALNVLGDALRDALDPRARLTLK